MFFGTNHAFDTISNVYVSNGLHQLVEHRKMLRWIGHILTNRKILVTTTEGQSQKHVLHEDISQGTLLSPVLFNAAVAQLHCPFIRFLHISIYDDDIWFLTFGSSQGSTKQKLNAGFFIFRYTHKNVEFTCLPWTVYCSHLLSSPCQLSSYFYKGKIWIVNHFPGVY